MSAGTWFITGCSSGLGRAMASQLLASGRRVAATARDVKALGDLVEQYGSGDGPLWTAALDVTEPDAIRARVDQAFTEFGPIDVVVNNAGYGLLGAAEEFTDEQIDRQLQTNLLGSIRVARAALPHLRAQHGGRIIQISSAGGQAVMPAFSVYNASKWGVEGFFDALALEIETFGIQVTIVEPGHVETSFIGSSLKIAPELPAYKRTPAGRVRWGTQRGMATYTGDVEKVVAAIIDSADHEKAPRRLVLGSDSYEYIESALRQRLADVTGQRELARSVDMGNARR
jgi:NAD(P)-dependent dehydrogenase (short-subunit alcohol dehydrogenase family)